MHKLLAHGYDLNTPPQSVTEGIWDEVGLTTFQDILVVLLSFLLVS